MARYDLSEVEWRLIAPLLPNKPRGVARVDDRRIINAIFYILRTGSPWRDLPERLGPWQTVYDHFSKWRKSGLFATVIDALQIKLDDKGLIDWELWCVDGASVRAARAAAGADKKVSPATRTSPPTTLWAAAEAGLDRSSTWLLTARAIRSRPKSPPGRCTRAPAPSRSSAKRSRV